MHACRPRALAAALALASFAVAVTSPSAPAATTSAISGAHTATTPPHASRPVKPPATPPGYHPHNGPAPADEYFGRLGMSILGVRNKVKDLGLDADIHPEHGSAILTNALWVEDAMRDWAKKYPFDRWLPRYAYALEVMYERIPGDGAHKRALKQTAYLTAYFPQTVYGRVGRAKLAMGVPTPDPSASPAPVDTDLQRLALLDGKVLPTIPPAATPTPSPAPSESPQNGGAPQTQTQTLPAPMLVAPAKP